MKELTIEQKAKAYDWALEVLHKYNGAPIMFTQNLKEEMFPELAESEDERIRKSLIKSFINQHSCNFPTIDGFSREQILAWLEKQGGQIPNKIEPYFKVGDTIQTKQGQMKFVIGEIDNGYYRRKGNNAPMLRISDQDYWELVEQTPTDKTELKFHEGDWTVSNLDRNVRQITEVHFDEYNSYYVVNGKSVNLEEYDRLHHLWSIQDAKPGDVLTYKDSRNNVWVCIFKEYANERVYDYCTLDKESFYEHGNWNYLASFSYTPATKEQRYTLMKAMADSGYTFDFVKRELKKIKQKSSEQVDSPAWSEEDEYYYGIIKYILNNECVGKVDRENAITWYSFIKNRIQPQLIQEWSEEDEEMHRKCICAMRASACGFPEEEKFVEQVDNWLKSLKKRIQPQLKQEWSDEDYNEIETIACHLDNTDNEGMAEVLRNIRDKYYHTIPQTTWKPSDEQITWLYRAADEAKKDSRMKQVLNELLSDLKKLREE